MSTKELLARGLLMLVVFILLLITGCQSYTETFSETCYEQGNIVKESKKEIRREGVPNWSEKHISYR